MKKLLSFLLALAMGFGALAADRQHTLKIYNWADYIDEDLLSEFEQWYKEQTGKKVKVELKTFNAVEDIQAAGVLGAVNGRDNGINGSIAED